MGGAWAWGDRSGYWGSDWGGDRAKNLDAYRALLAGGIDFIDTAEVYGFGKSEELIRDFMRETASDATLCPPLLATKFAPIPFRFRAEDVPVAYSPMAQGLLTGKYSAKLGEGVKAVGPRARILSEEKLKSADALVDLMAEIGANHGGVTPAQVAVNYCMTKGTV